MSKKKSNNSKKKEYKGPFPFNKNFEFDCIRKTMRTPTSGPTAETRSYNDSTVSQSKDNDQQPIRRRPRRKRNRAKEWISNNIKEVIIGLVVTGICALVGTIIYNHSNHFVSVDKDLEYIKKENEEQQLEIDKIDSKSTENNTEIKLLQQLINFKQVPKEK